MTLKLLEPLRDLFKDEVRALLAAMDGTPLLVAQLLYGTGMRLLEAMRLRGCNRA